MIKRICLIFVVALICLSLISCSYFDFSDRIIGGDRLDDELLSEIRDEIFGTDESLYDEVIEQPSTSETEVESEAHSGNEDASGGADLEGGSGGSGIVFWTQNGTVWHVDDQCGHLKNSKEVFSGTQEDAISSGKEKACSTCGSKNAD